MTIFHNFALRIQTREAAEVLKPNGNIFNKMQTDNHNLKKKYHNQWKVGPDKNGFEVSQNSILYVFCY